jgi:hypothetical protein
MTFAVRPIFGSGASGPVPGVVTLTNQTDLTLAYLNTQAISQYQLASNGIASISVGTGVLNPIPGEWLVGGTASDYEVRATLVGTIGVPPGSTSGTFGSWLSLGTTRLWYVEVTEFGIGTSTAELEMTVEIRDAATQTVQATATINLEARSTDTAPP